MTPRCGVRRVGVAPRSEAGCDGPGTAWGDDEERGAESCGDAD